MTASDPTGTVADLLCALTREEKLGLVRGTSDPEGAATGYVAGVERLGVPPFRLVDGPLGVRAGGREATAFPASLALAAAFDPDLAREAGAALGREAKARGQDAVLAPGANVVRVPACGRNFEYYSEDPALAGRLAAAVIEGLQSEDVVATVKHYVANNQETDRCRVSAEVDERTLRELYLRPFRAAVEAGAGSVMAAYNRVNGTYVTEHRHLLRDVLKGEWGFDGYVVSDWFATESTVDAANAGLDLEMPGVPAAGEDDAAGGASSEFDPEAGGDFAGGIPDITRGGLFGAPLGEAIDAGEVPEDRLDDMVARILGQMERVGRLDGDRDGGAIDTPEHRALAEGIAARGTVLLENDGVLPLSDAASVAAIGPNVRDATLGGGGSSETTPFDATSPAEGIRARADGAVTVARGVPPIEERSLFDALPFGDEGGGDEAGSDGEADGWDDEAAGDPHPDLDEAVAAARGADVAVVFVRDTATEGMDRDDLRLPGEQNDLVRAVAAANDRTAVVVNSSGPVELPWRDDVAAILEAWYPGQADGRAIASILYGDRDPSGRLPITFAAEDDYPATEPARYPGVDGRARYEEGLLVGYRHFDVAAVEPVYPFGHGLSYADFAYGDGVVVDGSAVGVDVENVGDRPGREVVQAYVRPPSVDGVERPVRELAGFAAISLAPGERRRVALDLDERAFGRYDPDAGWTIDSGSYDVEIGRSIEDVRTEVTIER
ncbi:beta-glucosidase [Halegenticoccus tardaugens]|uniref:beta-glucosidase n=1 Tax=Halegenticoccus tardaugens TaxID=2071624 RepID=UPI00100A83B6|nr:glycoside hydrolase family 3 C-terminal domain-containing protein [Halegenticoccus tardaugens]